MVLLSYQLSAITYQLSLFYNYVTFIVIGDQASARSCAFNNCLVVRRKSAAQAAFQIAHPVGFALLRTIQRTNSAAVVRLFHRVFVIIGEEKISANKFLLFSKQC